MLAWFVDAILTSIVGLIVFGAWKRIKVMHARLNEEQPAFKSKSESKQLATEYNRDFYLFLWLSILFIIIAITVAWFRPVSNQIFSDNSFIAYLVSRGFTDSFLIFVCAFFIFGFLGDLCMTFHFSLKYWVQEICHNKSDGDGA